MIRPESLIKRLLLDRLVFAGYPYVPLTTTYHSHPCIPALFSKHVYKNRCLHSNFNTLLSDLATHIMRMSSGPYKAQQRLCWVHFADSGLVSPRNIATVDAAQEAQLAFLMLTKPAKKRPGEMAFVGDKSHLMSLAVEHVKPVSRLEARERSVRRSCVICRRCNKIHCSPNW